MFTDEDRVKLESIEALKEAPLMFGRKPASVRTLYYRKDCGKMLLRKKSESGKWHKKKCRSYMVAHFAKKLGFRVFDSNGRTVSRALPGYLPGASGHSITRSVTDMMNWLAADPKRVGSSEDREKWSESQDHQCMDFFHSMLAGTTGVDPALWRNVISRMLVHYATDTSYRFGSLPAKPLSTIRMMLCRTRPSEEFI